MWPLSAFRGDPASTTNPLGLKYRKAIGRRSASAPTALATAASKLPAISGSSLTSRSARPSRTWTSERPNSRQAVRRNETRLRFASISVSAMVGSASRIGRPGIPLPAPMSTTLSGRGGRTRRKSRESRKSPCTISLGEARAVIRWTRFQRMNRSRYCWNRRLSSPVAARPTRAGNAFRRSAKTSKDGVGTAASLPRTLPAQCANPIRLSSPPALVPSPASCLSAPCTSADRSGERWRGSSRGPGQPAGSGT
jgi:hypothetical protein